MKLDNKDYVQIKEVLNNFSKEDQNKVPIDLINLIEVNANGTNYSLSIDRNNPLENQISRQAMGCIIYIVTKYIANTNQKNQLKKILVNNSKEFQESANERLNQFRQNRVNTEVKKIIEEKNNLPIETKKENFITKIINKIKNLLKIKKRS